MFIDAHPKAGGCQRVHGILLWLESPVGRHEDDALHACAMLHCAVQAAHNASKVSQKQAWINLGKREYRYGWGKDTAGMTRNTLHLSW